MIKILLVLQLSVSVVLAASLVNLRATNSSESFYFTNDLNIPLAVHGDTFVTAGKTETTYNSPFYWLVFQNIDGEYFNVAKVQPPASSTIYAFNNGKWMGGLADGITLFQLDEEKNPVNETTLPITSDYAALLSDSTIVYATETGFASSLFNEDSLTWSDGPTFNISNLFVNSFPFTSSWIDDNHIVCMNDSLHTFIFTRQSDKSWLETDNFPFNVSLNVNGNQFNLYSNGEDTVVFAFSRNHGPGSTFDGYLVIYTKVNNEWLEQVVIAEDFGFSSNSNLGARSFSAIDNNTLLFGAPYAVTSSQKRGGPPITDPVGRAVVLHRKNNIWIPAVEISTPDVGLLGVAVGVSNTDVIVSVGVIEDSLYLIRFYTTPRCLAFPIAACIDQEIPSCDVNTTSIMAYTVTQCNDLDVEVSIKGVISEDYSLIITYQFDREMASTSCNATLTCPRPPVTATPVTAPINAPVKAPVSKSVSDASTVGFSVVAVLLGLFNMV
jgi:hypothetical protein